MHEVIVECMEIGKLPLNLMDNRVLKKLLGQACQM